MRGVETVRVACIVLGVMMGFVLSGQARSGSLEPPPGPSGSTMRTLTEIYDKIESVESKVDSVENKVEEAYDLMDERCPECHETGVPKTGQTVSYGTWDDGDLEKGVGWPSPRFTDNGDGTVTDKLTGLIWTKNANCPGGQMDWSNALAYCNSLAAGTCDLGDGSVASDWRLPNLREVQSLTDLGSYDPALPSGHPFTNVQSTYYWTSTTSAGSTSQAWTVHSPSVDVFPRDKINDHYVWCVRGGQ